MSQEATNKLPPEVLQALTEQLRDVHLPEAISWWPLAWGWWVLLAIIASVLFFSILRIKQAINKNRYRGLALTELESIFSQWRKENNNLKFLQNANAILKRAIIHTGQHSSLATTSGKKWIEVLNEWSPQTLSEASQNALAFECYQAESNSDINAIYKELVRWMKKHKVQLSIQETETSDNEPTATQTVRGQHA